MTLDRTRCPIHSHGKREAYRPSGDVEAVLREILAGESDGGPDFAAPLAETFGSVAEHRKRLAAAQVRERPALLCDDPAAMEHEAARQAWLARVQRVNWR